MRRWRSMFAGVAVGLLLGAPLLLSDGAPSGASGIGTTIRVGVGPGGTEGNNHSSSPAISADGRYVAFESYASNLVPGGPTGVCNVFVADRLSGTSTCVSVDLTGTQADGDSRHPAISADGRYVAFESCASNLVAGDANGSCDIFVYDRLTKATSRVSVSSTGIEAHGDSSHPAISADGSCIAFMSWAANLVAGDTNQTTDIFVRDLRTGVTTRASVSSAGTAGNGHSEAPAISGDGRYVAFGSDASNLVTGDTNNTCDVFVRDRQAGATTRASVNTAGTQGDADSSFPAVSADGRYVSFQSRATNLGSGAAGRIQVFVRDRQGGSTSAVSVNSTGVGGNGYSEDPAISADGRYVAFDSVASNLVAGDSNGSCDIFVRDLQMRETTCVSVGSLGTLANDYSFDPAISADGRYVAFDSIASNLVGGDSNGRKDIFVRTLDVPDRMPPVTTLTTSPAAPDGSADWYKTVPSVSLATDEPGTTYYQWDATLTGGWASCAGPIMAPQGAHTLNYFSVDSAANTETAHSAAFKVDIVAPAVTGSAAPPANRNGWRSSAVTIRFSATDATSGVATVTPDVVLAGEGADRSVTGYATDTAGNRGSLTVSGISIDKTAPLTTASAVGTAGTGGWYRSGVDVTLSSTDALSGVSKTQYSLDGTTYVDGSTLSLADEGSATLWYRAIDRADNTETASSRAFKVDTRPPQVSVAGVSDGAEYREPVAASWSATDPTPGSGVGDLRALLDGKAWISGTPIFVDGSHTLQITCSDVAGNTRSVSLGFSVQIPPGPVLGLAAAPGDRRVSLTWRSPSDADFFRVRVLRSTVGYAASASDTAHHVVVYEGVGSAFVDSGLVNGAPYTYSAFARDVAGNWSAPTTTAATPIAPIGPATLSRPRLTPTAPRAGRYFFVSGNLSPGHQAAANTRLRFWRRWRRTWRLYQGDLVVELAAGATSYRVRLRLPLAGSWYARAYHACTEHRLSWSLKTMFRVR